MKLDKYINLDELKERMAPYTSIVLREDCEDLPAVIKDPRYIQPTKQQLKLYRAVTKGLIEECEEVGLYNAISGGAKMNKLQQVLSGFVYADDGSVTHIPGGNPRLEACLDEIQQHDGKVLVWCRFTQDIINVRQALEKEGVPCVEYHGKMSGNNARVESLQRFENDDSVKVLIGQPQAGGEGRDMSAASKIIWYSHTPDNIVRTQADERATAIGGDNVQLIDLVVNDSVDTYYLELLDDKRTLADDISRFGLRKVLERIMI
jgi:SNF2 family DNA or RNA helicase